MFNRKQAPGIPDATCAFIQVSMVGNFWQVLSCPYCGKVHNHRVDGRIDTPKAAAALGVTAAQCDPDRGYNLVKVEDTP